MDVDPNCFTYIRTIPSSFSFPFNLLDSVAVLHTFCITFISFVDDTVVYVNSIITHAFDRTFGSSFSTCFDSPHLQADDYAIVLPIKLSFELRICHSLQLAIISANS